MVSADVDWAVIRNNSAFLLKKRGVKKAFSTPPTPTPRGMYNGLVNPKAVGISAGPDNKGFILTTQRSKLSHRPNKSLVKVHMKAGPRRSLHKVKGALLKQRYRKDLSKAGLRRASAIVKSQKPLPERKGAKPAVAAAAKKE